jgi:hypothetical protein
MMRILKNQIKKVIIPIKMKKLFLKKYFKINLVILENIYK